MAEIQIKSSQMELLKLGTTIQSGNSTYYFLPFYFKVLDIMPISNSVNCELIRLDNIEKQAPDLWKKLCEDRGPYNHKNAEIDSLKEELANNKEIINGLEDSVVSYQEQIYLLNQKLESNKKEIADLYYKLNK